jgi:hypothetical protein
LREQESIYVERARATKIARNREEIYREIGRERKKKRKDMQGQIEMTRKE